MTTTIIEDNADYQVIRTTSAAGFTDQIVAKPGSFLEAQMAADANGGTLRSKAQAAIASNLTFQGQVAPTVGSLAQAQTAVNAIWAQMQTQSKELTAIIRLLIGALDSTSGT